MRSRTLEFAVVVVTLCSLGQHVRAQEADTVEGESDPATESTEPEPIEATTPTEPNAEEHAEESADEEAAEAAASEVSVPETASPGAKSEDVDAKPRRNVVGIELGFARSADSRNVYGNGFGRTIVFSGWGFEFRVLETYDLASRSPSINAEADEARLSITSVSYPVLRRQLAGPLSARAVVGLAWTRRSSLRVSPDDILSDYTTRSQHGASVLLGAGLELALGRVAVLRVDARAYPTLWDGLDGDRYEVDNSGNAISVPITDSPGGIPLTVTALVGLTY